MGSFSTMLNLQISIFLIMMVGLLFRKKNIITSSTPAGAVGSADQYHPPLQYCRLL